MRAAEAPGGRPRLLPAVADWWPRGSSRTAGPVSMAKLFPREAWESVKSDPRKQESVLALLPAVWGSGGAPWQLDDIKSDFIKHHFLCCGSTSGPNRSVHLWKCSGRGAVPLQRRWRRGDAPKALALQSLPLCSRDTVSGRRNSACFCFSLTQGQ